MPTNKHNNTIGLFALVLIVSSILKFLKIHWNFIDAYEKIGTIIMMWIAPELFTMPDVSAGVKTLAIYIPLVFFATVAMVIYNLTTTSRQKLTTKGTPK